MSHVCELTNLLNKHLYSTCCALALAGTGQEVGGMVNKDIPVLGEDKVSWVGDMSIRQRA